jgi:RNA polymerase sigma factor (TIGR02999 family)
MRHITASNESKIPRNMGRDSRQITHLLNEAVKGNSQAEASLFELTYEELHRLARSYMRRERQDHTLQPTALIHEAYLRLFSQPDRTWENRTHFFAVAASVMRHILIDHARRHASEKHGGARINVPLESVAAPASPASAELIALDQALKKLAKWDPRQVRIVELRYFAGLTEEEIAEILNISRRTVTRDWNVAKAWLQKELSGDA